MYIEFTEYNGPETYWDVVFILARYMETIIETTFGNDLEELYEELKSPRSHYSKKYS